MYRQNKHKNINKSKKIANKSKNILFFQNPCQIIMNTVNEARRKNKTHKAKGCVKFQKT